MRTLLTTDDMKNIVKTIFNGNLDVPQETYSNPNSEEILIIDGENGEEQKTDLATYLNIHFYAWKNRLVEKESALYPHEQSLIAYDAWVQSLNFSMNEAYALVELIDNDITASQDIDAGTKQGRITFLIQSNKIKNLDYYVSKIQNIYAGAPQTIQNCYGDKITAYILMGSLIYDEAPEDTQLGEVITVTCNFTINYIKQAFGYEDNQIEISLDGDDTYVNGQIPQATNYLSMPVTKASFQNIFGSNAMPVEGRPDLTGAIVTTLSTVKTLTFYDFNEVLTNRLNHLFWSLPAVVIDGVAQPVKDVNIPVYIRVKTKDHFYVYRDVLEKMDKVITNSDFNVSMISLRGWGKLS